MRGKHCRHQTRGGKTGCSAFAGRRPREFATPRRVRLLSIPLRSILDRIALLTGRPVSLAGLADSVARYELRRATSDAAFAVVAEPADLTALEAADAEFRTVPGVRLRPRVEAPTVHMRACD